MIFLKLFLNRHGLSTLEKDSALSKIKQMPPTLRTNYDKSKENKVEITYWADKI